MGCISITEELLAIPENLPLTEEFMFILIDNSDNKYEKAVI